MATDTIVADELAKALDDVALLSDYIKVLERAAYELGDAVADVHGDCNASECAEKHYLDALDAATNGRRVR